VVTSLKLKEMATVPVAPNVPTSKPRAAEPSPAAPVLDVQVLDEGEPLGPCELVLTVAETGNFVCTDKRVYKDDPANTPDNYNLKEQLESGSVVSRGEKLVYSISYRNNGGTTSNATITDVLPIQVKFLDSDSGCEYNQANRTVTCSLLAVESGGASQKVIRVQVLEDATAGVIVNTAVFTPETGTASNCAVNLNLEVVVGPKCDDNCNSNSDCPSDLKCIDKKCRNEKCSGESDCGCPLVCNDYCANDSDCPDGLKCSWNKCRSKDCLDDNDCSCDSPPGCNEVCNPDNYDNECVGGYVCDKTTKTCRDSACLGETDCTCEAKPVVKPPVEVIPVAGNPIPGFMFLAVGAVLVILGVVVVGL